MTWSRVRVYDSCKPFPIEATASLWGRSMFSTGGPTADMIMMLMMTKITYDSLMLHKIPELYMSLILTMES